MQKRTEDVLVGWGLQHVESEEQPSLMFEDG